MDLIVLHFLGLIKLQLEHNSLELVTDLFNPFSLEFLGVFEHLGGAMDVIYVGQLPPAKGIRGNALSQLLSI